MTSSTSVVVVVGGGPVPAPSRPFDLVIAADSGLDVALAAGLRPDVLVGDLDSISAAGRAWATAAGVVVESHPADKDHTDTALALRHALRTGARHVTLLAAGAGTTDEPRLDHLLGTLTALGDPALAVCDTVVAQVGRTAVHIVHAGRRAELDLPEGAVFSVLATHGPCQGVSISGARWPLDDAHLAAGSTRGISNQAATTPVCVTVTRGVLTVIVPETVA